MKTKHHLQKLDSIADPERQIEVEWYATPPLNMENRKLIQDTSIDMARKHDCCKICIRSDIHNTTGALAPVPEETPPRAPAKFGNRGGFGQRDTREHYGGNFGRRGRNTYHPQALAPSGKNGPFMLPNARIVSYPRERQVYGSTGLEKVFVEAPWHFTVEFQRLNGSWFSAHVYTETVQVGKDAAGKPRHETKGIADIGGSITENPQLWNQSKPGHKRERKLRFNVNFYVNKPLKDTAVGYTALDWPELPRSKR